MSWVLLYLGSVLLVPLILGILNTAGREEICFSNPKDVLVTWGGLLVWPITIIILFGTIGVENIVDKRRERIQTLINYGKDLVRKHEYRDHQDRSWIVETPEADLKLMLKLHRADRVNLPPTLIEIIREELLNRNMERNLLK